MGYWNAGEDGSSLHKEETGLLWGDEPADAVETAIGEIIDAFRKDIGRNPSYEEILAGFRFTLRSPEVLVKLIRFHDANRSKA